MDYRYRLGTAGISSVLALVLTVACGGRNLGAGDDDGGLSTDAQPTPDAAPPTDPCLPMDAQEAAACLPDDPVLGWAWDGSCCQPIRCLCQGADCDQLHASESDCAAAHATGCIELNPCEGLEYGECQTQAGCTEIYYGGGCFDLGECDPDNYDPDDWLCYEQAIACVPTGGPCNDREQGDCHGDCFWVEHHFELCFEQCCIDEGYGYCQGLPSCDCGPQEIYGCMDPCTGTVGFYWDGSFCQPITCCCEGPDCAQTWDTAEACWAARATCQTNECGQARGHCLYGDYVQPLCAEGYGSDPQHNSDYPEMCGMGTCCTPCPEEGAPGVTYQSHNFGGCPELNFDCGPAPAYRFDNECGCGCIDPNG